MAVGIRLLKLANLIKNLLKVDSQWSLNLSNIVLELSQTVSLLFPSLPTDRSAMPHNVHFTR